MTQSTIHTFKFIGCEILYREACYLAATTPHRVDVEFLAKGLHDLETPDMAAKIQDTIDSVDPEKGYEAILLGYARCNDGLVGIQARGIPLVIPKAHDCITLLFGSREAYEAYFDKHAGTYFQSSGWVEREVKMGIERPAYGEKGVMAKLGLTESYKELVAKHGKENADYIIETLGGWEKAYSRICYLDMGICDDAPFLARARTLAEEHQWSFEHRKGNLAILRKMFLGQWDDDFVVVSPGGQIVARNDKEVLGLKS